MIGLRPLPQAEEIAESSGLKVSYNYDDLVFSEHNVFILRFNDQKPEQLFVHFNAECEADEKKKLFQSMEYKAYELKMVLVDSMAYTLEQNEDEETMRLEFIEN